ncbi:hypothetical protein VOLCADRAFT_105932 [Volvox carteri f. nagariensis]|uniref:Oligosaccharyltransferase complex subunit n=1 Tax=Volvox carteri f. nagariensis TaxID=3068 RepID=D8U4C4_VOLCA|nr:uncharacterized protein VOLCADRAFT_105932 [Volvox carteri f. nagariensis]EFJ45380.1 hypothetical protein VOLCADRAFT_105932 [Volvox carteri f. nagariensis]|eukprot:XP_002953407.1 hypothetical protein VOLCADRAFT_105932 [Volvox carteri f. nagariensis]
MARFSSLEELRPSPMFICALVFVSYFFVTAGIAYDIINEPPAVGGQTDPVTGAVKPMTFMPYRMNGQFILEGLSGGFFYTLGGVGIILLDLSRDKNKSVLFRNFYLLLGFAVTVLSYFVCQVFIRIKMPGYMR